MSFLDKVKQAAEKAAEGAKKGTAQVKEKIELGQLRKKADEDAKQLGYLIVRERSDGTPAGANVNVQISFGPDYIIRTDTNGVFDTQINIPAKGNR